MPTNFCLTNQNQPIYTLERNLAYTDTYTLNGSDITTTNCFKDLGNIHITITNINFRHHYEKLIAGAYRMLGLLHRTFTTPCIYAIKQLYLTLVRSQMMYSFQLLCPFLLKDIKILEQLSSKESNQVSFK